MKTSVNWRQLSAAVLATLALATPAYAEQVSHSESVDLTAHKKTVAKAEGEKGKIEISPEEQQALTNPAPAVQAQPQAEEKQEEEQPKYREVRRNGVTYIEKVGKEKLQKEKAQAKADAEQEEARATQQKEILKPRQNNLPAAASCSSPCCPISTSILRKTNTINWPRPPIPL